MAHSISALIGPPALLTDLAQRAGSPVRPLPQGLVIAPLGEDQHDRLTQLQPGDYREGFVFLSAALEAQIIRASQGGALAYVETEYFGGGGSQAAMVAARGTVILCDSKNNKPASPTSPINRALALLGVTDAKDCDAFETLGLDRLRDNQALGLPDED